MYFEILKYNKLIKRGKGEDILSTINFSNELMGVPSFNVTLPIDYLSCVDGREDFKLFVGDKVFWGRVRDITVNKSDETIELVIEHIVSEWRDRQISVNNAQANKELNIVFKGSKIVKNKGNDEDVTASDFSVMFNEVPLSNEHIVARAHARAWVTSNGDSVPVTVKQSTIKKKQGTYKVTFATAKGTEITINVEVKSYVSYSKQRTGKNGGVTIKATAFTIETNSPSELSNSDLVEIAKAQAYKSSDKETKYAAVVTNSTISDTPGKYSVTFSSDSNPVASVTITVRVKEFTGQSIANLSDPSIVDKLEDIYNDVNFVYPGWHLDIQDGEDTIIDYVYSKQSKLDALTKTMELTDDLFWRVDFSGEKVIQIGRFGEKRPYVLSTKPSGKTNIRIIEEPTIEYDFENVVNVATVYSQKSDGGMSSLTLREIYENPNLQDDAFPVVILRENVNNERDYSRYITQYPMLAPNNALEYAIIDTESVALEGGHIIEGSYAFNDISSFNVDGKKISDSGRRRAARTAYRAAIRKLKQARRSYVMKCITEELPADILPGDKVRLLYDNRIWHVDACSSYWKKILSVDDWFYVTNIEYQILNSELQVSRLTLSKYLKIERESTNQ